VRRLLAIAFILFCFEIGVFLVIVPWTVLWENNFLLDHVPMFRPLMLNNFVRGAVSGLGVIDLFVGLSELVIFVKSLRYATPSNND